MFEIKDKMIYITKGDSAAINVKLKNQDGTDYTMQTGDKLTITVRKKIGSAVLMTAQSTSKIIDLTPTHTKNLEVGSLFYDIQLTTAAGDVFTVAGAKSSMIPNFRVYPEVTE